MCLSSVIGQGNDAAILAFRRKLLAAAVRGHQGRSPLHHLCHVSIYVCVSVDVCMYSVGAYVP